MPFIDITIIKRNTMTNRPFAYEFSATLSALQSIFHAAPGLTFRLRIVDFIDADEYHR